MDLVKFFAPLQISKMTFSLVFLLKKKHVKNQTAPLGFKNEFCPPPLPFSRNGIAASFTSKAGQRKQRHKLDIKSNVRLESQEADHITTSFSPLRSSIRTYWVFRFIGKYMNGFSIVCVNLSVKYKEGKKQTNMGTNRGGGNCPSPYI